MVIDILPWTNMFFHGSIEKGRVCMNRYHDICMDMLAKLEAEMKKTELETGASVEPRCIAESFLIAWEEHYAHCSNPSDTLKKETIINTVEDLIGAGSEGVVNFIHWSVLYLARFPETQQRLREDIRAVIGFYRLPEKADRFRLPRVDAFIWEVVRHAHILPFTLPHTTTKDTTLEGYFIPEGTLVLGNLYSVNYDETNFKDPAEFVPERFLNDDRETLNSEKLDQIIPFGLGKRKCLGELLGRYEMFLFVVVLLQKCSFAPIPGQQLTYDGDLTLTYRAKPYKVLVTPNTSV